MSRFVAITAVRDFEGRIRQAITGALHGELQTLSPEVLAGGPDDVFRQLNGAPPEVLILGPGVAPDDALKLATVFDLQYPEISLPLDFGAQSRIGVTCDACRNSGRRDSRNWLKRAASAAGTGVLSFCKSPPGDGSGG
ncbi:hypothetical protein RKD54_001060 [Pseudarthrobacter sp. SLBN-100]